MRYYFDWAASAPPDIIQPCVYFGNPSSLHKEGREAKNALEDARNRCAAVLNVKPETLFFTGTGTESNAIAILSNLLRLGQGRTISSIAEHASVSQVMETLQKMGKPTGSIAVDSFGIVTSLNLEKALGQYNDVRFCCAMAVNNETGSITDIPSLINDVIRKQTVPVHFHCDLVQSIGKIPVDISAWDIDSASISAHKLGGPRGIGLLYLRRPGIDILYKGGGQESGIRGGTENIQGALAFADCLEKYAGIEFVRENYLEAQKRMCHLVTSLLNTGRCTILPVKRELNIELFSPYILQAAFNDIPGEVMARALDDLGFAVSTGSACSSSSPERPVLTAMGIEEKLRIEGIRISQGFSTTIEEIDLLLEAISEVLKFL